jgi:aryl-alcohol dehydrogenase-like predicted oxidoreductase
VTEALERPERRVLGRTGWDVPALGLGTYCLTTDWGVCHDEAVAIVRRALALGVDLIDTAPLYGSGEAEVVLREALRGERRPHRILEKVGRFDQGIFRRQADRAYVDAELIEAQLMHSLRLLGRESVDALLIHEADWDRWWSDAAQVDGAPVVAALEHLRREGRVERIGISARDVDAAERLCATGRFDLLLFVHFVNVVWQEAGDRVVAAAAAYDMGLVVGAPFRRGLLLTGDDDLLARLEEERRDDVPPGIVERIRRARALADEAGMSLAELGLRYLLSLDGVHCVLVGVERVEQLEENVGRAARGPLPADLLREIAALREVPPGAWASPAASFR